MDSPGKNITHSSFDGDIMPRRLAFAFAINFNHGTEKNFNAFWRIYWFSSDFAGPADDGRRFSLFFFNYIIIIRLSLLLAEARIGSKKTKRRLSMNENEQ